MIEVKTSDVFTYSNENIPLDKFMKIGKPQNNLFEEMKELNTSKPVEEKKSKLFKDLKKPKTETVSVAKKKKKKSKNSDEIDIDQILDESLVKTRQEESIEQIVNETVFEMYDDGSEFDIGDSIIQKEKRKYNTRKNSDNNYKKEFAEELTLLYNLLDEVTKFGKDAQKIYESTMLARSRGVSGKTMTDYAQMLVASQNSRLAIIKELSSIKKTIADLGLKEAKSKNESVGGLQDNQLMAATFLRNITNMRSGQNPANIIDGNFTPVTPQDMTKQLMNSFDEDRYFESINTEQTNTNNQVNAMYDTSPRPFPSSPNLDGDGIGDYLERRLDNYTPGPKDYARSEEGNKYIMYENLSPSIVIDKHEDTGEWEFVAIDKYENPIPDYPLPMKSSMRLKFSDDGKYATDQTGKLYPVRLYI